ncbi:MAG: DUF3141 domain-containing protein [Burkholderiaceae bacterium]|nr:DUF3141 domain-containing protein [Burkholderiaceae bacterium]
MTVSDQSKPTGVGFMPPMMAAATEYLTDTWQRSILYADVMRQRGNQYQRHMAKKAPNVLSMKAELVMYGHNLPRPVNYVLTRIVPPKSMPVDPIKRPFVVVDPRAGHGPGIAGFKPESEIGVAVQAGHPCYFIGFLPNPEPDQTVEDVVQAEARFLEEVISLHPEAEGKPVVVGNCQAGWQIMMTAAIRPELFGPIVIAGAPLSYWAGWRGKNPMRYTGGLSGGSWLTMMASDLGNGKFDGANLVQNFENLNPGNTHFAKQYNLYANIDTESERYLGFERWWGGHVYLNGKEIQYIVDNLFVGNRLATSELVTTDGTRIDLRNINSPIIVFCSKGDNITPPPQALGWIIDLYETDEQVKAHGQTIVYTVHESIGHLGIFVSGAIANKEHREFTNNIDMIDVLPPGLYEAIIEDKTADTHNPELTRGDYVTRFERRTLDDIRKIVEHNTEDDRRFAAVSRISDINVGLYRSFVQPWLKLMVTPQSADLMQKLHPLRLPYEVLSDKSKLMASIAPLAVQVRNHREAAPKDNPFRQMERQMAKAFKGSLDLWGEWRDQLTEQFFMSFYGTPLVQNMVGLGARDGAPRRHPGVSPEHLAFVNRRIEELRGEVRKGGLREASVRVLMYVSQAQGGIDERSYRLIRTLRQIEDHTLTLAQFKHLVREQALVMTVDPVGAISALPELLRNASAETIREASAFATRVVSAGGPLNAVGVARLAEAQRIFEEAARNSTSNLAPSHFKPSASRRNAADAAASAASSASVNGAKAAPAGRATAGKSVSPKDALTAKPATKKTATAKVAAVKSAPVRVAPVKSAPVKVAPVKTAPTKVATVKTPLKSEATKVEVVKPEPAKVVTAKAAATRAAPATTVEAPAQATTPATVAPATWKAVSSRKKANPTTDA